MGCSMMLEFVDQNQIVQSMVAHLLDSKTIFEPTATFAAVRVHMRAPIMVFEGKLRMIASVT